MSLPLTNTDILLLSLSLSLLVLSVVLSVWNWLCPWCSPRKVSRSTRVWFSWHASWMVRFFKIAFLSMRKEKSNWWVHSNKRKAMPVVSARNFSINLGKFEGLLSEKRRILNVIFEKRNTNNCHSQSGSSTCLFVCLTALSHALSPPELLPDWFQK